MKLVTLLRISEHLQLGVLLLTWNNANPEKYQKTNKQPTTAMMRRTASSMAAALVGGVQLVAREHATCGLLHYSVSFSYVCLRPGGARGSGRLLGLPRSHQPSTRAPSCS